MFEVILYFCRKLYLFSLRGRNEDEIVNEMSASRIFLDNCSDFIYFWLDFAFCWCRSSWDYSTHFCCSSSPQSSQHNFFTCRFYKRVVFSNFGWIEGIINGFLIFLMIVIPLVVFAMLGILWISTVLLIRIALKIKKMLKTHDFR